MSFLSDNAMDNGLAYLTSNGTRIDICSSAPVSVAEATTSKSLGYKAGLAVGSPANGAVSGRKVQVPAITDGVVNVNGTATHWALTDVSTPTELLAWGTLSASQVVTAGNTFTLDAIDITIPDPA